MRPHSTPRTIRRAFASSMPPWLFQGGVALLWIWTSACSTLKEQKDVFIFIQSDLPLELGDERSTVGATNEWMPIYQLGKSDAKILIKADNQVLDTLIIRRTRHPYNTIRKAASLGAAATLATLLATETANDDQILIYTRIAGLWTAAYLVDVANDPYPVRIKPNKMVYYNLPNRKRARYEQIMAKARAADSANAKRKPASELTTVDYMPTSLRSTFGLTAVPLSSASPPTGSAQPNPVGTPATAAAPRAGGSASPATPTAPAALTPGTPASATSTVPPPVVAAGNALVQLKNTGTLPVRVYLSVEKSFVVRAQSTLPVEVPVGASLFLAKNTRPLELKSIGIAPPSTQPTLTLDLQHILTTWH